MSRHSRALQVVDRILDALYELLSKIRKLPSHLLDDDVLDDILDRFFNMALNKTHERLVERLLGDVLTGMVNKLPTR